MKKIISLLFTVLIGAGFFTACGQVSKSDSLTQGTASTIASQNTDTAAYTVALVMKTLTNPFFVDMEKGARKAESDFGIKLIVRTGAQETSIEQQIQIVEELIAQDVDAIVIAPGSSIELVHVLKQAQTAGIVIVNIDNRLDQAECEKEGLENVPFISVQNDKAAYLSAKYISDAVKTPTKAIILEGILDSDNSQMRTEGAKKAMAENPNITLIASKTANWKIDEAYSVAKELFTKNPDIGMVFCANDMMALGVVQYLKEADRTDVLLAGFDNLEDVQTALAEGWMDATIEQQANLQGYEGIKTAVQLLHNETVEKEIFVPVELITAEDLR